MDIFIHGMEKNYHWQQLRFWTDGFLGGEPGKKKKSPGNYIQGHLLIFG